MKNFRIFLLIAAAIAAPLCATPRLHAQGKAGIYSGSGSPEGHVAATAGDVYVSSAGTIYLKSQGSGKIGWIALSSGGPIGAAGGDLSGTYPNPTVATIGGNTPSVKICAQVAIAMPTSLIGSAAASSAATGTCTGLTTSDSIVCTSAVEIAGVTGFVPSAGGILAVNFWPTANTIHAEYLNNTSGSITPGALTLNCGVSR